MTYQLVRLYDKGIWGGRCRCGKWTRFASRLRDDKWVFDTPEDRIERWWRKHVAS